MIVVLIIRLVFSNTVETCIINQVFRLCKIPGGKKVELKSNHGFLSFRVLTKCHRTLPEADIITLSISRFHSKCQSYSCFENICVNTL